MNRRVKGNAVQSAKRAEGVASENDNWIWAVIFATTAITALAVIALFTIAVADPLSIQFTFPLHQIGRRTFVL